MLKEHEDKIKEDEKDLESLSRQIQKIQKLRHEYSQQKEQLGSLKNIIYELKSENQQLRSKSCINEQSQRKQKKVRHQDNSISSSSFDLNAEKKNVKSQAWKSEIRNNFEETADPEESKTRPKNSKNYADNNNNKIRQLNLREGIKRNGKTDTDFHQPSLRNHSGYISTGRLLTPQRRNQIDVSKKYYNHKFDELAQENCLEERLRFDTNYFSTKNRLVDNLVADLQFQLEQKQAQYIQQAASHKQTKKMLKKTLNQNEKMSELNNRFSTNNQLLQKENEYLKKQLIDQTEMRHRLEARNQDLMLCHNTIAKRVYEQSELQFMAMDAIYFQFEQLTLNLNKYCLS